MQKLSKITIVCLLFVITNNFFASKNLDSLLRVYKTLKDDTTKIKLVIKISSYVRNENPSDSIDLKYLHEQYLSSKLAAYPKLKIKLCRTMGDAYLRLNMFESARRYFIEALGIASTGNYNEEAATVLRNMAISYDAERNHEQARQLMLKALTYAQKATIKGMIAGIYNGIAAQYYQTGKSDEAIKYFYKSLEAYEALKDTGQIVTLLRNMSLTYDGMKDYVRTKQLLYRALNLSLKAKDSTMLSYTYGSLGALFQNMQSYDSALIYNAKQISYMESNIDPDNRAIAYGNLGVIYRAKKDYARATENYLKALEIFKKTNSYRLITISTINMGEIHVDSKNYTKALQSYRDALKQSEGTNELDLLSAIHRGMYNAYSGLKDYKNALEEFRKVRLFEDSMKNEQNLTKILRLESDYEVGKKTKRKRTFKSAKRSKANANKRIERERKRTMIFLYSALAVILIIMVLTVLLYKGLKQNKEKNKVISEQKHLVEEKNKDITDSINYAKRIQEALLPPKELKYEIFSNAFVYFKPREIVSGDFYWFHKKDGKRIITAVDCTGHGVPGAFNEYDWQYVLTEVIEGKGLTQPAEILSGLRHLVIKSLKQTHDMTESKDGMDMALLVFDDKKNTVEFAGANNPLWLMRNGECIEFKPDKRPIGYYRGEGKPFTNHRIELQKGDTFYIFTDGYADQFGGKDGKKLKYKPFREILLSIQDQPMLKQEEILDQKFEEWKGSLDQIDDVLIIGIRV